MTLVVVIGALAGFLAQAQSDSRSQVRERFDLRAQIASRFVNTYVSDLIARQRTSARLRFAGPSVPENVFQRTVTDAGFEAAVLVDRRGRLLRVTPAKPSLLGSHIAPKYKHLTAGVRGHVAVSKVVPSAARGIPIVAFAVPFGSAKGRRVYSGAYDVSRTPLGSYLKNVTPVAGNMVLLVDNSGKVIAKNGQAPKAVTDLQAVDPALATALGNDSNGEFDGKKERFSYASEAIKGTPWRIVIAVPSPLLYDSVEGPGRWASWIAILGLAIGGVFVVALLSRLFVSRTRLATLNSELDRLSRIDALTGLHNRRHLNEVLEALVSASTRHGDHFAVLLADIDHFKQINDQYGHHVGDEVLCACAQAVKDSLRTEDSVARWGGEEFLVALPGVDLDGAIVVANRVRKAVSDTSVTVDDGEARVTLTIGVALWTAGSAEATVNRADAALYLGKKSGRDTVETAPAEARDHHRAPSMS